MHTSLSASLSPGVVRHNLARLLARLRKLRAPAETRYVAFRVAGQVVGALKPQAVGQLRSRSDVFELDGDGVALSQRFGDCESRSAALADACSTLAADGVLPGWRDELYRIASAFAEPPLAHVERAAARFFGIHTWAAHLNGVVAAPEKTRMWIARRSPTKPIDPGMLDNLVGGGIASGASISETLHKECWEEAGIPPAVAQEARAVGVVEIRRDHQEGLQVETIFMHDLWLPAGFVPANQDGEVTEHRLCDLDDVFALIAEPDAVTLDATLVALDFMRRAGAFDAYPAAHEELAALVAAARPEK